MYHGNHMNHEDKKRPVRMTVVVLTRKVMVEVMPDMEHQA